MIKALVLCCLVVACKGQYNYNAPSASKVQSSSVGGIGYASGSSSGFSSGSSFSSGSGGFSGASNLGGAGLGSGISSGSSFSSGGYASQAPLVSSGISSGFSSGVSSGSGFSSGISSGLSSGIGSGISSGIGSGISSGFSSGVSSGSSAGYSSGSAAGYSSGYASQAPIVHKHVYVHVAPEEPEEQKFRAAPVVGPPQKHYKIIFVKTPSPPAYSSPVIPLQPQNEEKTLVYVLVKKPEDQPDVVIPTPAPTQPSKPEVYFIKYKTQKQAHAVSGGVSETESVADLARVGGSPAPKYGPPGYQN